MTQLSSKFSESQECTHTHTETIPARTCDLQQQVSVLVSQATRRLHLRVARRRRHLRAQLRHFLRREQHTCCTDTHVPNVVRPYSSFQPSWRCATEKRYWSQTPERGPEAATGRRLHHLPSNVFKNLSSSNSHGRQTRCIWNLWHNFERGKRKALEWNCVRPQ